MQVKLHGMSATVDQIRSEVMGLSVSEREVWPTT